HFTTEPVTDFASSSRSDQQQFNSFFHHMLKSGVYLPPSAFESWFLNNALSAVDIAETLKVVGNFS
ncbi:MAG TPA: aspartate aminotransferase family protein, partial [Chitinophagaceae bacterium]|nr:aspartate aminotransferase family protein [Chitinophagaceae bacterium]